MLQVEARIEAGIIPRLVEVSSAGGVKIDEVALAHELAALEEDVLNWNCGHAMTVEEPAVDAKG